MAFETSARRKVYWDRISAVPNVTPIVRRPCLTLPLLRDIGRVTVGITRHRYGVDA